MKPYDLFLALTASRKYLPTKQLSAPMLKYRHWSYSTIRLKNSELLTVHVMYGW